ncbi:Hypothetical predicted protein [Mytilus galloprovincialis]|uniref:Uncharacterized protein n=1 Tax=Mytilus galloprovincialis TaxID=29158 RepID=A0A8B6GNL7_MYTGA|nr:Hypothetical predicted protein [Mytilus galloprovincialis]
MASLPQSDEILLCTKDTPLDVIEIFWRRALFAESKKVYCLVNVDLLNYEVSDKAEVSLDRHMQSANEKGIPYQLVVFCGSENEFKSRMVAAIDSYRRLRLQMKDESHVKSYLSKQLCTETAITSKHALCVDIEKSSVRVVKSVRAGLGKTLFVKNMKAALDNKRKEEKLNCDDHCLVTISIYGKCLLLDDVAEILLDQTQIHMPEYGRIFHIDIAHEVEEGLDLFLFQLIVLGCVTHRSGHVWRKSAMDYFIVESMPLLDKAVKTDMNQLKCLSQCMNIFPDIMCRSPVECLRILSNQELPG